MRTSYGPSARRARSEPLSSLDHDSLATTRWAYSFEDADPDDVALLGGKGAGLSRMSRAGLPVPPGFIITTRACAEYVATGKLPAGVTEAVRAQVATLEQKTGRTFGGGPLPLLVSVRSGAPVSMPGIMETILNLGIGHDAAVALAAATGEPEFVLDVTRRLQKGFSEVVLGSDPDVVDGAVANFALRPGGTPFAEMFDRYWARCRQAVEDDVGAAIPADPWAQLRVAVMAVLRSWNSRRAITYRDHHDISHDLGTAVVVQTMVFGNLGSPSGAGVAFTRNPLTGERALYGEFLEHGQGEDVVAGVADPETIAAAAERTPEIFGELARIAEDLELAYGDALDIEYTVERGKLYVLQVRSARRTPEAAIRIAADMLRDGRLRPSAAVAGVSADHLRWVERPRFDQADLEKARAVGAVIAAGIGASPGHVTGSLVLDSERAVERAKAGRELILARPTTSPRDLHGLIAAAAIVTARGGATSHAAVVARALAKPCVVGCGAVSIDEKRRTLTAGERVLQEGDAVSIDGGAGELLVGSVRLSRVAAAGADLSLLMDRSDAASGCSVLARVRTPAQARTALERGAAGVLTSIDDVLATTGQLVNVLEAAVRRGSGDGALTEMHEAVAEAFTPLLTALNGVDIDVRAIDARSDEAGELVPQALLDDAPQLLLPIGDPDVLRAEMDGLALAAERSGYGSTPRLVVRHVSDPIEARTIRRLGEELAEGRRLAVGSYLTSPRAVMRAADLAEESDVMWIDVRALQEAMLAIPTSQLLTSEPLDGYMRRGMLAVDPRSDIDSATYELLEAVAEVREGRPGCRIGMRLRGRVSDAVAARLHGLGFRLFAVDPHELRVARLALGKAAWK
jgi:pyruvate,orthophosphate dikinase